MLNTVKLHGAIQTIKTIEKTKGNKRYNHRFLLHVPRVSGVVDEIPVSYDSDKMLEPCEEISVLGKIRTIAGESEKNHRYFFVKALNVYEKNKKKEKKENKVSLKGIITKKSRVKRTTSGRYVISFDLETRENINGRTFINKIPCVAWGYEAFNLDAIEANTEIELKGRFQMREYMKPHDNKKRVTYEVSISEFKIERV